jgi:hypothetical protein
MPRRAKLLLTALVASFALAPAARAAFPSFLVRTGFWMPSRNILCNAGPLIGRSGKLVGGYALACVLGSDRRAWYLRSNGRSGVARPGGNAASDFTSVLRYGHTWRWHGFRCSSRQTGLTCSNRSGHGFFLSRATQRLF